MILWLRTWTWTWLSMLGGRLLGHLHFGAWKTPAILIHMILNVAFLALYGNYFLLQALSRTEIPRQIQIYVLGASKLLLQAPAADHANTRSSSLCVRRFDIAQCGAIVRVLGVIKGGNRMVYVSADHTVYTFQLHSVPEQRRPRHGPVNNMTSLESEHHQQVENGALAHKSSARKLSKIPDKRIKELLLLLSDDWVNDNAVKSSAV